MKKGFFIVVACLYSIIGLSQSRTSDSLSVEINQKVDVSISKEIKLGSTFLYKKYYKLLFRQLKEPYGNKQMFLFNGKSICTINFNPEPFNHFIQSFEVTLNKKNKVDKNFVKFIGTFTTNKFKISLGDSLSSVIDKLSKANVAYEEKISDNVFCINISKELPGHFGRNEFLNADYLASYCFENSILVSLKISYPTW